MKNTPRIPNHTCPPPSTAPGQEPFLSRAWGKAALWAKKPFQRKPRASASAPTLARILLPGARERFALPAARQMTPQVIENILRSALTSPSPSREQELYTLMEQTWPRLAKNIQELKNAVIGLEWNVMEGESIQDSGLRIQEEEPPPRNPQNPIKNPKLKIQNPKSALARRARLGMRADPITGTLGWEGMLRHLLDGWFRGVSLVEIAWQPGPHAALPASARPIPAAYYGWQQDGRLMLYPDGNPDHAQDIPRDRVLIGIRSASSGHPSGGALLRSLAWYWCASNFCSEWFLSFAQIFGQPFRWATYATGDQGAAEDLAAIMEGMGTSAWGVGPEGTAIAFHETSHGSSENPQLAMLERADTICDILILGQTLTTDVGDSGSRALGEVHTAVRADIVDSAANWLAEILNEQLLPTLVQLNTGAAPDLAALPYWEPARKQGVDTKVLAETIEILTRAGMPIPQAWAYTTLDIPEPQPGEATLTPPAPDIAPALAGMPVEARAYILSHLRAK